MAGEFWFYADVEPGREALARGRGARATVLGNIFTYVFVAGVSQIVGRAVENDVAVAQNKETHRNLAAAAGRKEDVAAMQQRMALYKNHQPWRESFRATNAPVKP